MYYSNRRRNTGRKTAFWTLTIVGVAALAFLGGMSIGKDHMRTMEQRHQEQVQELETELEFYRQATMNGVLFTSGGAS